MRNMLLVFVLLFVSKGFAGGSETHGGDQVTAQFMDLSYEVARDLARMPGQWLPDITLSNKLNDAIQKVEIKVQERVFYNDKEVQAINIRTGEKIEIVVSRTLWNLTVENRNQYLRLVLHEYLPLIGFVDDSYQISNEILELLSIVKSNSIDRELIHTAFHSEEMASRVLIWMRQSSHLQIREPAKLVLEIVMFAKNVSHQPLWEIRLSKMTSLILKKMSRKERANSSELECAVAYVDAYDLAWFYEVDNDLRDLYPRAKCSLKHP